MAALPRAGVGIAVLRVVTAIVFLTHGWPKLTGGVDGLAGMLGGRGFPAPLAWAWLVTLLETAGALLLALGVFVAPIALLLAVEMVVAILLVHLPRGWYVADGGMELNVLLIAALVALILAGPGAWALRARVRTPPSG